jgi:hypothetical protein
MTWGWEGYDLSSDSTMIEITLAPDGGAPASPSPACLPIKGEITPRWLVALLREAGGVFEPPASP